jgi:hypothetical protein
MSFRNRKLKKRTHISSVAARQLTKLEFEIKQFAEANFANEDLEKVLSSAKDLKNKAEAEQVPSAYKAMIDSKTAILQAKNNNWQQGLQEILGAIQLIRAAELDSNQTVILFTNFNAAIMTVLYALMKELHKPLINEVLNRIMADDSDMHEHLRNKLWHSAEQIAELESFISRQTEVMYAMEEIYLQVATLQARLLQQSCFFYGLMKVVNIALLQSGDNVIHQCSRVNSPKLATWNGFLLQAVNTCFSQLNSPSPWRHNPQEQYYEMRLILQALRLLMINVGYVESYIQLFEKINKYLVSPWSKHCKDLTIKCLIQQFRLDELACGYATSKKMGDIASLHQAMQQLIDQDKQAKVELILHTTYVFSGLLLLCNNYLHKYCGLTRFQARNQTGNNDRERIASYLQNKGALPSMQRTLKLGILYDSQAIMEQLLSSLLVLQDHHSVQNNLLEMPFPHFEAFLLPLLKKLPTMEELQTTAMREMQGCTNSAFTEWVETLEDLQHLYELIGIALSYFASHSHYFMFGNHIAAEFYFLIQQMVAPRLKAIADEITRVRQAQPMHEAQIEEKKQLSDQAVKKLIQEHEKSKERYRLQVAKKATSCTIGPPIVPKTNADEDENNSLSIFNSVNNSEAQTTLECAIKYFTHRDYQLALREYQHLYEISQHHRAEALDGMLACQTKILIDKLYECERLLCKIAMNPREVAPEQAEHCYKQLEVLHLDYEAVRNQHEELAKDWQSTLSRRDSQIPLTQKEQKYREGMHFSISLLKSWQEHLVQAWQACTDADLAAKQQFAISRYNKIMLLGFNEKKVTDIAKREALLAVGYQHQILQKNHQSPLFAEYCNIYKVGRQAFFRRGEENKEKYGLSLYTLHRQLLAKYDHVLRNFAPPSILQKNEAMDKFSLQTIELSTTIDEVFRVLCQRQLLSQDEQQIIKNWGEAKLKTRTEQEPYEIRFSPSLAYEFISSWLISTQLVKRYNLLNSLGLIDLLIPFTEKNRLLRSASQKDITESLQRISKQLANTPFIEWKNDRILAHVLTVILFASFTKEELKENLSAWYSETNPLYHVCHNLQLSAGCQGALHTLLASKLVLSNEEVVSDLPEEILGWSSAIHLLKQTALSLNQSLLQEGNVQEEPCYVFLYGESALLAFTSHRPSNASVCTNISKRRLPFPCEPHPLLADKNIYRQQSSEGVVEPNMNILILCVPLSEAMKYLDFTVHNIMWDVLVEHHVYWTKAAKDDLQQRQLRSLVPFSSLQQEPERLLRYFVSINYQYKVASADIVQLQNFAQMRITREKESGALFLSPFFNPARLYHFLLKRLTTGKSSAYVKLAADYGLLGLIFAIPLVAQPLSPVTLDAINKNLLLIDNELLSARQNPSHSAQDCLARIIAVVLYHSCTALASRDEMLELANKATFSLLACNNRLLENIKQEVARFTTNSTLQRSIAILNSQPLGIFAQDPLVELNSTNLLQVGGLHPT